ncbi:MAG TPA: hypothetical protein DCR43_05185 [Bacteroidales bacterium]|nr:MAG: hypothetical protein A2X11_10340 [Bacteroidetes bacterium GWE2_42_24]OFY32600.1 MAG: hypothetical protein A2X09_02395 [Bacteroidetes bacterium GWF2_43_11]HAQ65231.1 hypothetical protein [Bacteroidales bacterium]HBZ65569.1 hypothetical protein [Bacteroidales bacterium]
MRAILFFVILLCSGFLISCSEDDATPLPTLQIATGEGVVTNGDTIGEGTLMFFRLILNGNGTKITNLVATITYNDQKKTMMDFGLWKENLDTIIGFYKSDWQQENWTFTVMTEKRDFASAGLTILKDTISSFGSIVTWPLVTLSFQGINGPHYFDVETGEVLTDAEATVRQSDIDLLVYYYNDAGKPSPTFSSPGDQDALTHYPVIGNWTTLNYTKYDYVSQTTPDAFDKATNDSLLIKQYDDVWGRRKYKYATAGWVFPFKTANGKIGLIKVLRSDVDASGTIDFAVKVQP